MRKLMLISILITASLPGIAQTGFVLNAAITGFEDRTRIVINKILIKDGEESMTPDQTLSTGSKVSLAKMKGKVVLLDFWFAGCARCRAEHKNYLQVYQAYRQKGFEILSVNSDNKKELWTNAMQKDSMIWKSVWDPQQKVTSGLYQVRAFPTNYLINEKGEIIGRNLHGEALAAAIERIF